MRPGLVYDCNGRILADAVAELGGEPWFLGAFRDDEAAVRDALDRALAGADLVLLSGGTSKGEGDLNARVVAALDPGIVVHGVALKPGKPICLAAHRGKPVVILPGFPTSAIFTFHEFVAPVIRRMSGVGAGPRETVTARLAVQTSSERGRLEYLLVGLVRRDDGQLAAYPMGKGSGSGDGVEPRRRLRARRPQHRDRRGGRARRGDADRRPITPSPTSSWSAATAPGSTASPARSSREGFAVKVQAVGSQGGLAAAQRGECDAAPMHLLDPATRSLQRAVPRRRAAAVARLRADAGRRDARRRDARRSPRCSTTRRCAW